MSTVFDLVLGVFKEPGLVAELRDKQLPDDLALVIRLAAGEDAALQGAVDSTGVDTETLVEASVFFLQQVLFAPGADSYRVLGADPSSPQDRLRENYRWLMKWLHPDRNQDGWEAVYADHVNVAWQDLKTPARRAEYDRRFPSAATAAMPMSTGLVRRVAPQDHATSGPLLSGSTVRRLPTLILGSLGIMAAAIIGITYWAQTQTEREIAQMQRDRAGLAAATPVVDTPPANVSEPADVVVAGADADTAAGPESIPVAFDSPAVLPATSEIAPDPVAAAALPEPMSATAISKVAEPASVAAAAAPDPLPMVAPAARVAESPPVAVASTPAIVAPEMRPVPAPSVPVAANPAATVASAAVVATPASPGAEAATAPPSPVAPARAPVAATAVAPVAASSRPVVARTATRAPDPASAAPATVVAQESPATSTAPIAAAATPPPLRQSDAEALVREFASAYASGDLARFDRLLSGAGGNGAALDPMRSRFMSTEMRYLEIQQMRWHAANDLGHVRARFRDTYVPRGERKAVTESGEIEWTIRVDAGDARIASVARNDARP